MTRRGHFFRPLPIALAVVAVVGAGSLRPAEAASSPRAVVQAVIDEGLAIVRQDELAVAEKREALLAVVEEHFDFETLAKLVLARHWREFSAAQQREFVEVFRTHLALTYSKNLARYDNEVAVITGDQEEARGDWTVRSRVVRPHAEDVLVNYRLRQTQGRWRMIDVVVEGVSLVSNWRSQFREVLGNRKPEDLIRQLRQKNEEMQNESAAAAAAAAPPVG